MEVAAGFLLRRAAGMKDGGALVRREAGEFQFLERAGWHGRNLRPAFYNCRRQLAGRTDFAVGGIIFELECEQFQREFVEVFKAGTDVRRLIIKSGGAS